MAHADALRPDLGGQDARDGFADLAAVHTVQRRRKLMTALRTFAMLVPYP